MLKIVDVMTMGTEPMGTSGSIAPETAGPPRNRTDLLEHAVSQRHRSYRTRPQSVPGRLAVVALLGVSLTGCTAGATSTSPGTSTTGDSGPCDFLRRSLADFQAPNPGPTTSAESQEVSEIQAQLISEGC